MDCPKCGCKVTYPYDDGWDMQIGDETRERCAACGHVFDEFDAGDSDDDYDDECTVQSRSPARGEE